MKYGICDITNYRPAHRTFREVLAFFCRNPANSANRLGQRYTPRTARSGEAAALGRAELLAPCKRFSYTKALAAFRRNGASAQASRLLAAAREHNPHVPAYLSGRKRLPARLPDYIGLGDASEAVDYAASAHALWESVPGALAWLES